MGVEDDCAYSHPASASSVEWRHGVKTRFSRHTGSCALTCVGQWPTEEVQSLLPLLFVQEHKVFTGLRINLQESWLNGSNLSRARLEKAVLRRTKLHGADLRDARLHGAELVSARLHGVFSQPKGWDEPFEESINGRIGKESDLSGATFCGGLTQEDVDSSGTGLSEEKANLLREELKAYIGKQASNKLLKDSHASTGTYTKEEAAQWIAD